MTRIGLLSDTHGHWDERIKEFFQDCDEVWHAGDIGNIELADQISGFKTFKAVYGNIDDQKLRLCYPETQLFTCEALSVVIKHIGGYPNHYEKDVKEIIGNKAIDLLICGHSHILKVMYDKKYSLMYMNPGAYGITGFHKFRTALRFVVDGKQIRNLDVLEIKR